MATKAEKIVELLDIISNKSGRIKKLKLECGQQATKICVLNLRIKELYDGVQQVIADSNKAQIEASTRIKKLEDALTRIDTWAKAYPLDIFPKPDLKQVAKVLKAAGMTLDAISADAMRHVLDGVKDITEQALKEDK